MNRPDPSPRDEAPRPAYRRATGSARGEARRRDLLDQITEDLAANGLVDYSLRRAARAAGTTHKVLLYYFDGIEDLLGQALHRLRERRIAAVLATADGATLGERVVGLWPALADDASGLRVIDQAIGLAMYDPQRYAHLAQEATPQYEHALVALCPPDWSATRKVEIAELAIATFRGCLMEWQTTRSPVHIDAALAALARALDREVAAG
jgi:AcrR family transcriptional regulator